MTAPMTDGQRLVSHTQRMALQAAKILDRIAALLEGEVYPLAAALAAELSGKVDELVDAIENEGAAKDES
jgi:hypothetical protein